MAVVKLSQWFSVMLPQHLQCVMCMMFDCRLWFRLLLLIWHLNRNEQWIRMIFLLCSPENVSCFLGRFIAQFNWTHLKSSIYTHQTDFFFRHTHKNNFILKFLISKWRKCTCIQEKGCVEQMHSKKTAQWTHIFLAHSKSFERKIQTIELCQCLTFFTVT